MIAAFVHRMITSVTDVFVDLTVDSERDLVDVMLREQRLMYIGFLCVILGVVHLLSKSSTSWSLMSSSHDPTTVSSP